MNQKIWGKYGWYTLHMLTSITPPIQHTKDHYLLVSAIAKVLPCYRCRINYTQNLKLVDRVYLDPNASNVRSTGLGLNRAFFDIHNIANQKTNKPIYEWDQFQLDMKFERHMFTLSFVYQVMVFCSFIAYAHDNLENEIQSSDILEFLRIVCACLISFQEEHDIGMYCLDIGTHGMDVIQRSVSHLSIQGSKKLLMMPVVQSLFSPFLSLTALTTRPIPDEIAFPHGKSTITTKQFHWPHYNVHNASKPSIYMPHNPNTNSKNANSNGSLSDLFSTINNAVGVVRVGSKKPSYEISQFD